MTDEYESFISSEKKKEQPKEKEIVSHNMKDYQVLISGILIAAAIYLGLTHTSPDPYEGSAVVETHYDHDTDLEVCMKIATELVMQDGEPSMKYDEAVILCTTGEVVSAK